jgi:hypothetical protein
VQELFEQYEDQGFMPMTLMTEGGLQEWADAYGLTHPVLADRGFPYYSQFVNGSSINMPNLTLLAPGLEIIWREKAGYRLMESDITPYLPENY